MKILFLNLENKQPGGKGILFNDNLYKWPKLNFPILSACLKNNFKNVKINIFDKNISEFNLTLLVDTLSKKNYDLLGIYAVENNKNIIKNLLQQITLKKKFSGLKILIGGPAAICYEEFLNSGADYVCLGEGEQFIVDIIKYLKNEITITSISGIAYLSATGSIVYKKQNYIENLDSLPFPDRSLDNIYDYYDYRRVNMRLPFVTIMATRGCYGCCTYCSMGGIKYRTRTPNNVINEILTIKKKYGLGYLVFEDDMFGANDIWLKEFCEKMITNKVKVKWSCNIHPLVFIKNAEKKLKMMIDAGLDILNMGLQTVNKKTLITINRDPREIEAVSKIIELTNKLKIGSIVSFIIGLPGETTADYENVLKYCLEHKPLYIFLNPLSIFKGTMLEKSFSLSKDDDEKNNYYTTLYTKKYFMNPIIILKWITYIIRNNPCWPFKIFLINFIIPLKHKKSTNRL